jgi:hypothetical protein
MRWSLLFGSLRASALALTSLLALGLFAASPSAAQLAIAIEANPGVAIPVSSSSSA